MRWTAWLVVTACSATPVSPTGPRPAPVPKVPVAPAPARPSERECDELITHAVALGIAERGLPPGGSAAEGRRGVIDDRAGAARPPDRPTVGEDLLRTHDAIGSLDSLLAPALDPTYAAALLVVAAERCATRDGRERDHADYDRCMRRVLDVELARPPQHAAHRGPSTRAGCP